MFCIIFELCSLIPDRVAVEIVKVPISIGTRREDLGVIEQDLEDFHEKYPMWGLHSRVYLEKDMWERSGHVRMVWGNPSVFVARPGRQVKPTRNGQS